MYMLNRFSLRATLCGCVLLLCFSLAANADEIQDINKLFKQGKQEQALTRVNTYLVKKPKDAQARFLKGLILTEQDKTDEAIKVFSALTEDFPELPEPYNNLAVLYANQGQYDKARTALEMAIRTNPSYATAHENLGDIYAKMASQAYDRALQLNHGNSGTQTKLAMVKDIFSNESTKSGKAGKTSHKPSTVTASASTAEPSAPASVPVSASVPATASVPAPASTEAAVSQPVATPHQEASAATVVASAPEASAVSGKPSAAHKQALAHNSNDVLKKVHEWAAAWSSKNVKGYLAAYAKDFKVPGGASRAKWEEQRNDRIRRQKSIRVGVENPKVTFIDDSHASVSFKQSYRASRLHTSTSKTLIMVDSGDKWLIQEERTGK